HRAAAGRNVVAHDELLVVAACPCEHDAERDARSKDLLHRSFVKPLCVVPIGAARLRVGGATDPVVTADDGGIGALSSSMLLALVSSIVDCIAGAGMNVCAGAAVVAFTMIGVV